MLLGGVACTAVAPQPPDPVPAFGVTPNKDDIDVALEFVADADGLTTAVVDIHSASGIGQVDIAAPDGAWPDVVELRLHLAGLENLTVDNGDMQVTAAVASSGSPAIFQSKTTADTPETPITPADPAWIPLTIETADGSEPAVPLQNGTFVARLPVTAFAPDARPLTVRWIDFYR